MASISLLNPKAEFARASQALTVNIGAAMGPERNDENVSIRLRNKSGEIVFGVNMSEM